MDARIRQILDDLYKIDENLIPHEKDIMGIIEKMIENKPDTQFDTKFQRDLETRLKAELAKVPEKKSFKEHIRGFASYLKFSHRYSVAALAGLIIIISVGSLWFYSDWSAVPTVIGGNISLEYRKIPYNVESLDVKFSTPLDTETVNAKNVILSPYVEGQVTLVDESTIHYQLLKPLTIDENYILTVSKQVASAHGVNLSDDFVYNFKAIGGAKATKVLPSGEAENLSQNITVLFNIPVVPLTTLDNSDKLPCPLTITPKLEGTCKWTSPTILEYIPKNTLEGATEYSLKVADVPGLLYKLSDPLEAKFTTPKLEFTIATPDETYDYDTQKTVVSTTAATFRPTDGVRIRANFPIDAGELASKISFKNANNESLPITLTPIEENGVKSESRYSLTIKGKPFVYDAAYTIYLNEGIKPKYGNIASVGNRIISLRSTKFYDSITSNQRIYSATGVLVNTKTFSDFTLPHKSVFFQINFAEEVPLTAKYFSFQSDKGEKIPFDISYVKEKEILPSGQQGEKLVENKLKVELSLKSELAANKKYQVVIDKSINSNLTENVTIGYTAASNLEIKNFTYVSNTEMCVYLSNDLYDYGYPNTEEEGKVVIDAINFEPKTIVRGLNKYVEYDTTKPKICPDKEGSVAYFLNARLNPKTKYTLTFGTELTDKYGTSLAKAFTKNITSGNLRETDKYLYTSLTKEVNVIPTNLPIVMNLQSINLGSATVEVCEMGIGEYQNYVAHTYDAYYQPSCLNTVRKSVQLKNKNWYLSPNKFDVEKDILGTKISQNFILVRGSTDGTFQKSNGYMDSEREFRAVFIRSNLSLTLEKGANKQLLFASSFDGKDQPSNLTFTAYTQADKSFIPMSVVIRWNNDKKVYEFPAGADIDFLVAKNDAYFGVIEINADMTSNYDFHYISGQDTSTKDYLYIYPDRPLYKPGDTVFFKGLLRTFAFDGYRKSSVTSGTLKIVDENGTVLKELDTVLDRNANFDGKFTLPSALPFGRYHFEFFAGKDSTPVYNDGHFFIEEYKKPTFKVNLSVDKTDVTLGDTANVTITPEYYFGGKVINTDYVWSALKQKYYFDAKDYKDYQFGEGYAYYDCLYWGYCDFGDELGGVQNARIDASGKGTFSYDFPTKEKDENDNILGEKLYSFNVTITDPDTKKTVSNTVTSVLHTTDGYVGLQVPYWTQKDTPVAVHGVVLDYSAKPMSGKSVTLELYKKEWKNIKKQGVDGIFYNDYSLESTKENSLSVSSDGNGEWTKEISPKTEGEYEVRAIYTGANGKSFTSSRDIYVSGDSYVEWNNGNNTTTDLTSEKSMLKIGDTAKFTLKSPVKSGKMLITVEKDDGILDYMVTDVMSYGQQIELPIKASYYPNIYIKAFVIGSEVGNPLPIYKRAMSVIKVVTDYKKLSIEMIPDKKSYLPGEKITLALSVKDTDGKPVPSANGSIAVVDESLLALKGNPKKNPFAFFYEMKRYLGVETYLSLSRLIEKLEVKDIGNGEKGGAGEGGKGGLSKKKRGVFKDTAYWLANFTTDSNGVARITTDTLPDNLTTWDIESVVSTADNRIGVGEITVMTNKQVMIDDNLPRFFGVGDAVTLAPTVFNKTGKDGTFIVTATSKNATLKETEKEVFIKDGEQAVVPFALQVTDIFANDMEKDNVSIAFKANLQGASYVDEVEKVFPLKATSESETVAVMGKTKDVSVDERINLAGIASKQGEITVKYGATLLSNLLSGMDYLAQFPYGCSEQRTSSVLPNLLMKRLYTSASQPFDLTKKMVKYWSDEDGAYREKSVDEVIKDYLVEIKKFQKFDGGFDYWSDITFKTYSDFSLSAYILSSVSLARDLGYPIDRSAFEKTVSYLKNRFYAGSFEGCAPTKENRYCAYPESYRTKAVEAIIAFDANDYEAYKMYKLLKFEKNNEDRIAEITLLGKLETMKSLKSSDKAEILARAKTVVNEILSKEIVINPRGSFLGKAGGTSRVELTSRFVEGVSNLGLSNFADITTIIDGMNGWILGQKKDGHFGSTQETAIVTRALATYLEASGELKNVNMKSKITLNSDTLAETSIDSKNLLQSFDVKKPLIDLQDNNIFHTEKLGVGTLYYDVALRYSVPLTSLFARDEGFSLTREYFDYNEFKKIDSLKKSEYEAYLTGAIDYKSLKYPKEVYEYLMPVLSGKVGQLLLTHNRVITPETRDKVAFEGFIPSGTELVNVNLSTEDQSLRMNSIFDREEFRDDRYFGYTASMDAGIYSFDYILRLTHDGTFSVKPSRIFEFYNEKVFGRTGGKMMKIEN